MGTIWILIIITILLLVGAGVIALQLHMNRDKVKVILNYGDRRMKIYKVKPKDNTVTVDNKTFNINDKDFILHKNVPTFIFKTTHTEPINVFGDGLPSPYTPSQYRTAIDNKIVEEIFNSTNKKSALQEGSLLMLLLFGIIGGLGLIAYLGYDKLQLIITQLNNIIEALKSIGLEV